MWPTVITKKTIRNENLTNAQQSQATQLWCYDSNKSGSELTLNQAIPINIPYKAILE